MLLNHVKSYPIGMVFFLPSPCTVRRLTHFAWTVLGGEGGRRLGAVGASQRWSVRVWAVVGVGPSRHSSPSPTASARLAAKAHGGAMEAIVAHLEFQAAAAAALAESGASRALARARRRRKMMASLAHRPPISRPKTAKRHRGLEANSG